MLFLMLAVVVETLVSPDFSFASAQTGATAATIQALVARAGVFRLAASPAVRDAEVTHVAVPSTRQVSVLVLALVSAMPGSASLAVGALAQSE
jgi:hypothetical protein